MVNLNLNQSGATDGAGLDVTSVVDQLLYAARAPERLWQQEQLALASQGIALNSLSSAMNALKSRVQTIADLSGVFSDLTATSSEPGLVTASAQSNAAPGVHTLVVSRLATVSSYYTDPVAGSTAQLAHGSFTLGVGTGSNTITIDGTNDTLEKLAAYINAHDYGVQASVLNDANGARLALVSKTSGSPGDLSVSANGTALVFHKSADGLNASFTLDGVPLTSANNTVSSTLPGVTLNLLGADSNSPVTLTIAHDTDAIVQALNDFVSAYNAVAKSINGQFKASSSGTAGALAGNSALRSLQSTLLSDVTYSVTGNNGIVNLASLGIDMEDDGNLSVDSAKLDSVLKNQFTDVQAFFQSVNAGGFGNNFNTHLITMTGSAGALSLNLSENSANQRAIADRIDDFEARLEVRRQFLIVQYSQVDAMLRQYPVLLNQISSQIGTLSNK